MKKVLQFVKILILPLIAYLIFVIVSNGRFGSFGVVKKFVLQSVYPTIIGLALYNIMEMGLWDFTPGSVLLLSGIVGGNLATTLNLGLVGMVLVTIGTAMILTVINCLVLQYTKIPPMIASCGVLMVYETLAAVLFNGTYTMNRSWSFLGRAPWAYIIFLVCLAVCLFINKKTTFAYNVRALGRGQNVAVSIGVNMNRTGLIAYLLEGVFLGIAAVLYLCTQGSASAKMNMASTSISLTAIIAVVVGQHLSELCNPVVGIWIGTVTIKIISSGLLSLGVSTAWQKIINGIFFALLLLVFSVKDILEDQKKRQTRIKALQ